MAKETAGKAAPPQGEPAWDAERWMNALLVDAFHEAVRACNEEAYARGPLLSQEAMQECIRDRMRGWLIEGRPRLQMQGMRGDASEKENKVRAMVWFGKLPPARQEELLLKHTAIT